MEFKKYNRKYRKAITSKHVVSFVDQREEAPKSEPTVEIGGQGLHTLTMNVEEARELEKAIHKVLWRVG